LRRGPAGLKASLGREWGREYALAIFAGLEIKVYYGMV